ncbi:MAG: TraB/GumN family protein [Saprospiraceae bacterium]|nr:TraB/GumN family protein [Saprospiraceae bacterium]
MKRIIVILCFFGALSVQAFAQSTDTLAHALLWEISGNGLEQSSYLFGTIHMIPKEDYDLPDRLLARLAQSDRLVLELDMDKATNIFAQLGMIPKMLMPDGIRIGDLVSAEDYLLVQQAIEKAGLPNGMIERVKPLFLSALLDPELGKAAEAESYDLNLYHLAKANDIKHSGLESVKEQMAAFDSITLEDQAKMLVDQLKGEEAEGGFTDLVGAYKSENLNQLAASMEAEAEGDFLDVLLYNRNRNWIPIMARMMKKERVFFGVGAGHLAGEKGVVRLLEAEGYRLRPIPVFRWN